MCTQKACSTLPKISPFIGGWWLVAFLVCVFAACAFTKKKHTSALLPGWLLLPRGMISCNLCLIIAPFNTLFYLITSLRRPTKRVHTRPPPETHRLACRARIFHHRVLWCRRFATVRECPFSIQPARTTLTLTSPTPLCRHILYSTAQCNFSILSFHFDSPAPLLHSWFS